MKILYGVQGTGNGHLARARLFATALARAGHRVDWLFSGREPSAYFDMDAFGDARRVRGLGLAVRDGRVDRIATARAVRPLRTLRELHAVRPERHDLVISDYEPLTAWAARFKRVPSLGIGHQHAFGGDGTGGAGAPEPPGDRLGRAVLRRFAPTDLALGLHWARYRPTVLPPVIDASLAPAEDEGFTLVYRPFESSRTLLAELRRFDAERFELFGPDVEAEESVGNVRLRPCSHAFFRERLVRASRVICSTGFALVSEALHLGLPLLTRPLPGQHEQQANALALEAEGLARVHRGALGTALLERFATAPRGRIVRRWPDVAGAVVRALEDGPEIDAEALSERLWRDVEASAPATPAPDAARPGTRPGALVPAALAAG